MIEQSKRTKQENKAAKRMKKENEARERSKRKQSKRTKQQATAWSKWQNKASAEREHQDALVEKREGASCVSKELSTQWQNRTMSLLLTRCILLNNWLLLAIQDVSSVLFEPLIKASLWLAVFFVLHNEMISKMCSPVIILEPKHQV